MGEAIDISPEHEAVRKGRISSSRIAAVMGVDRYVTPLQVWCDILGLDPETKRPAKPKVKSPQEESVERAKRRGRRLERECVAYGAEEMVNITGHEVEVVDMPAVVHPIHDWISDKPDAGYKLPDGRIVLVDAATVGGAEIFHKRWGDAQTDQVDDPVLLRDLWHLLCHPDSERVMNPVLVGGWKFDFQWWMVERDAELEELIVGQAHAWYERHVVKQSPPPATVSDGRLLARLYTGNQAELKGDPDVLEWAIEAKRLGAEAARMKHETDKIRMRIRERLGEHTSYRWGQGRKVTLSKAKPRAKVNWHRVATELGAKVPVEDFSQIVKNCTYDEQRERSLRITIPGLAEDDDA